MSDQHHDPMNERHAPPGARKRFRKSAWIAAGLLVMFLAAMAITSTTIGIVDRPGHDPGSVQKAPGDEADLPRDSSPQGSTPTS
ncbi:hypothetical protein AB3M93_15145 [Novosphingobium panipatense]|nr:MULTISPECIES: hypothetical protein [Novosphingobium]